jgi:ribosomal protein S18 acetylase RimI-like enzyme
MSSTVRVFEERDLDAVVALSLRAWVPVFDSLEQVLGGSGVFAQMYPDWRVAQRKAVRDACGTDGMKVWVAEVDSAVAGFVAARLGHAERMGEIYMIAVDPAYQRQGVGVRLTSVAVDWMKDNGMALAMVETGGDPGHAPARRTYDRYFKTL